MRERLREVAQSLAAGTSLFGVQANMVRITEHLLEEQPGVFEAGRVGAAGARERLNEPERTHVEGALAARQPIGGGGGVVPVDQTVRGQTARGDGPPDRVQG